MATKTELTVSQTHLKLKPDNVCSAMREVPLRLSTSHTKFPANAFSPDLKAVDYSHKVKTQMYTESGINNRFD